MGLHVRRPLRSPGTSQVSQALAALRLPAEWAAVFALAGPSTEGQVLLPFPQGFWLERWPPGRSGAKAAALVSVHPQEQRRMAPGSRFPS